MHFVGGQSLRRALQVKPGVSRIFVRANEPGIWSRGVRGVGWLCAAGSAIVLLNLLMLLAAPPEGLRPTPAEEASELGVWIHMDLGIAWFGWWGYAGHVLWLPVALSKGWLAWREGRRLSKAEGAFLAFDAAILVAISAVVRLTWLRYPSFNVPLL